MSGDSTPAQEYQRQWYEKNKLEVKERAKQWRINNKEQYLSYNLAWKEAHPAAVLESSRRWNAANRDTKLAIQNRYRKNDPYRALFYSLKARSTANDLPFNLSLEYLTSLPKPTICPVLGITIDGLTAESRLEVDRLVPELGYTIGNISFISGRANRIKSDASVEELLSIAYYTQSQLEAITLLAKEEQDGYK